VTPTEFAQLTRFFAETKGDPYTFVMGAFPWGQGELTGHAGPEAWQHSVLDAVRDGIVDLSKAVQIAVASGHGVGKSTLVAWLILWSMATMSDTRGTITANTENQLKTKTWAELAKWYRLFLGKELFEFSATRICSRDPEHAETWRIDMVPWSERNTEAFSGLHNQGKRVLVIYDEASSIPDMVHEATEGIMTDAGTQIIWCKFGNPTRNTGRFREAFGSLAHRWRTFRVDSREVRFSNKSQIERWIDDYGVDSDFVRVRVLGEFPRVSSCQFIPTDLVEAAMVREVRANKFDPMVIGVDVARFGDDASRIVFRRGRDARMNPSIELRGVDTMTLATRVVEEAARVHADAIFVDGGGVGGGVVDRLRQLRAHVFDVQFGAKPDRVLLEGNASYANKRAEMYGYMREWLKTGGIEPDTRLRDELIATEYALNVRDAIQLERKEDLKRRLPAIGSPDWADALALTFAYPVMPRQIDTDDKPVGLVSQYDPFQRKEAA
jgi:hypothetical protein